VHKAFARHETFHPRYGWLKKGYDAAASNPDVFLRGDAPVILGVGKNMVRAIRYWCRAFKVLDEYPRPSQPRVQSAKPTQFGHALLDGDGWDPYLENPASLWLLHWYLLRPECYAPAWSVVFNRAVSSTVSDQELLEVLFDARNREPEWADVADASLRKDRDCLIRMYAYQSRRDGRPAEDGLDSPFAELELLQHIGGDGHHYAFQRGHAASLPAEIVVCACLDYMDFSGDASAQMISMSRLALDEGAPGRVFRIGEEAVRESVAACPDLAGRVQVVESVGGAQLVSHDDPAEVAWGLLDSFYRFGEPKDVNAGNST